MREFDLVIIGAGSANSIPEPEHGAWKIAVIEKGKFGGTCLTRGCIPSKMLLQSAQVAEVVKTSGTFGVRSEFQGIDWKAVTGRVWNRLDPLSVGAEVYSARQPNTTVFKGEACFTGHKVIEVNGEQITGRHIVIAAGGRTRIPEIPGLEDITTSRLMKSCVCRSSQEASLSWAVAISGPNWATSLAALAPWSR